MQEQPGRKAAEQYLIQRIEGASPEQLVAMLLGGGQKFIHLVIKAGDQQDLPTQANYVNRTADIIVELKERLNHEDGGELVENLERIYDWWMDELFTGAQNQQPERLQRIFSQMGEFKETWEKLHQMKTAGKPSEQPRMSLDEFSV